MPDSRTYHTQEACPVARTLDAVGDRWTILVLRELSFGRKRYSQLLTGLDGISTNLLAERLKKLEDAGMIHQVLYSERPRRFEYRLTEKGRAFVPVLQALRDYGEAWEPRRPQS